MEIETVKWSYPTSFIISGASGTGKTVLASHLIKYRDKLFKNPPKHAIIFYEKWQKIYSSMQDSGCVDFFHEGLPNAKDFQEIISPYKEGGCMVVFDDMSDQLDNFNFYRLYAVESHHDFLCPVLILHNLFTKNIRNLSLNCHHFLLTLSPRDLGQVGTLSKQSFGKPNFLPEVLNHIAGETQHPYVHLNFHPKDNNILRTSARIFPNEPETLIYQMSNCVGKGEKAFNCLVLLKKNVFDILTSKAQITPSNSSVASNYVSNNIQMPVGASNIDKFTASKSSYLPQMDEQSEKSPKASPGINDGTQTIAPQALSTSTINTQTTPQHPPPTTQDIKTQTTPSETINSGEQAPFDNNVDMTNVTPKNENVTLPKTSSSFQKPKKSISAKRGKKIPHFNKIFKKKPAKKHLCTNEKNIKPMETSDVQDKPSPPMIAPPLPPTQPEPVQSRPAFKSNFAKSLQKKLASNLVKKEAFDISKEPNINTKTVTPSPTSKNLKRPRPTGGQAIKTKIRKANDRDTDYANMVPSGAKRLKKDFNFWDI